MDQATTVSKNNLRVLIVDDEPGLRQMLVFGLSDRGYDVVTASSGEEGIEKAKHDQFNLVVCDIMMPGMNGVETLKGIKQIQPSAEIIMATGFATLETAIESMKQGAYDYITKPYELNNLVAIFEKALERQRLKNRVGKLEELNRLKSEFLANMSHELRTPMNAIMGYTSLLLDRVYGELVPEQDQSLKRIQTNAKNLLELINNILDFSKLSAGRMPLYAEDCDLGQISKEIVETMESLACERNLKMVRNVPDGLVIKADKTKLKQVLINLLGNAIKFTHEGEVELRIEMSEDKEKVNIYVRDSGIGIKEEDVSRLFQDFKQLDASSTREYGGTGLGLSISKKIIELHGGSISVKSVVGVGSTFTVTLPVKNQTTQPVPAQIPSVPSSLSNEKIILSVDDDMEALTILEDSLKGSGFKFVGAQSGQEGLAMARQLKPHAITLDIMMPYMDGWSVLQSLKNDPELRDIPVFIISIMENKALGYSLGVTDYLIKPFDRQELLSKLKRCKKGRAHRILVLDDDQTIVAMLEEMLKADGFEIQTASEKRDALVKLGARPDILFLDLMMPTLSGFDVLEAIEQDPNLKDMRVFVMTGKHLTPEETKYLERRVEMIVQKGSRDVGDVLSLLREKLMGINEAA